VADIVMTDDGISFGFDALEAGPLGGAETAFISLARAFAARGHRVFVRNHCPHGAQGGPGNGEIDWAPLADGVPPGCDLHIANRSDKLLALAAGARRLVFWLHNPASYLLKFHYLSKLWRLSPAIVFAGDHHAAGYPRWAPAGQRVTIPYGISEDFRTAAPPPESPQVPPPPRAVFTSSPLRGLDWLLEIWVERIRTRCPDAELHLFTGAETYGEFGRARAARMAPVLAKAAGLEGAGVVLRGTVTKAVLASELAQCRVLLYRGDVGETFCLAVGEAQAAGVPAVVQNIGCVAERVVHGETGFVAEGDAGFADAAVGLLGDDALWRRQSRAAADRQGGWGWQQAAAAFEELIP
jgi:glycosyltransferase involved in cell wall biosynthesis